MIDMNSTNITKHFNDRAKKRAGLNKKTAIKFYDKARTSGLRIDAFESRPIFFNYLKSITKPNYHVIIYNRYILVCSDNDDIAITLLNLPKEYYSVVNSICKIKKEDYFNDPRYNTKNKGCNTLRINNWR